MTRNTPCRLDIGIRGRWPRESSCGRNRQIRIRTDDTWNRFNKKLQFCIVSYHNSFSEFFQRFILTTVFHSAGLPSPIRIGRKIIIIGLKMANRDSKVPNYRKVFFIPIMSKCFFCDNGLIIHGLK